MVLAVSALNFVQCLHLLMSLNSAVAGFSSEERAKLLQFVTGTSKTPLNGFADLEGMNGITKFNIHKDYGNKDRLPSSHTCFNRESTPIFGTQHPY